MGSAAAIKRGRESAKSVRNKYVVSRLFVTVGSEVEKWLQGNPGITSVASCSLGAPFAHGWSGQ